MCVPTDFRRKVILQLIEALKESPSFRNIALAQLKEAVLNSEHQTYQQSKTQDDYFYMINEKLKKIKTTSPFINDGYRERMVNGIVGYGDSFGYEGREGNEDRGTDSPERNVERAPERTIERSNDRPVERTMDRSNDRPVERVSERSNERPVERVSERSNERPVERISDRNMERPDKTKIINGNIPSYVNISQMYTQESGPPQFNSLGRKMDTFASSFEQSQRNLEAEKFQYQEHKVNPQMYYNHGNNLGTGHFTNNANNPIGGLPIGNSASNITGGMAGSLDYVNYTHVYKPQDKQYNFDYPPYQRGESFNMPQTFNNAPQHGPGYGMKNTNASPNFQYTRNYGQQPGPAYGSKYPMNLMHEKNIMHDKGMYTPQGIPNVKPTEMYGEKGKRDPQMSDPRIPREIGRDASDPRIPREIGRDASDPRIPREIGSDPRIPREIGSDPRIPREPGNYQANPHQNHSFFGFTPFSGTERQIPVASRRENDPRMSHFMMNQSNSSMSASHLIDPPMISHPGHTEENQAGGPRKGQREAIDPRGQTFQKTATPINKSQSFEYGYATTKGMAANRSFIGNINPNLINEPLPSSAISNFGRGQPSNAPSGDPAQARNPTKGRMKDVIFDEKKSEELFKSIGLDFAKVAKKKTADPSKSFDELFLDKTFDQALLDNSKSLFDSTVETSAIIPDQQTGVGAKNHVIGSGNTSSTGAVNHTIGAVSHTIGAVSHTSSTGTAEPIALPKENPVISQPTAFLQRGDHSEANLLGSESASGDVDLFSAKKIDNSAASGSSFNLNSTFPFDSFIESGLMFSFKEEALGSEIPKELEAFLCQNSLKLKKVQDRAIWKMKFRQLYNTFRGCKNRNRFSFGQLLENQQKFINFIFLDEDDLERHMKSLTSVKETNKDDYLKFIDRAIETYSEKKEELDTTVGDLSDA